MSSPVLTTTVTSSGATTRTRPRRNLPAPTPPASATTFIGLSCASLAPPTKAARLPRTATGRRFDRDMPDTDHQIRRAVARARAGKTLSVAEVEALLGARG